MCLIYGVSHEAAWVRVGSLRIEAKMRWPFETSTTCDEWMHFKMWYFSFFLKVNLAIIWYTGENKLMWSILHHMVKESGLVYELDLWMSYSSCWCCALLLAWVIYLFVFVIFSSSWKKVERESWYKQHWQVLLSSLLMFDYYMFLTWTYPGRSQAHHTCQPTRNCVR